MRILSESVEQAEALGRYLETVEETFRRLQEERPVTEAEDLCLPETAVPELKLSFKAPFDRGITASIRPCSFANLYWW